METVENDLWSVKLTRRDGAGQLGLGGVCAGSFGRLRLLLLGRRLLAQVLVDPLDERRTHVSAHPLHLGLWPATMDAQVRREGLDRLGVLTGSREHHPALVQVHEDRDVVWPRRADVSSIPTSVT